VGRRLKYGFARLALLIGGPLWLFWAIVDQLRQRQAIHALDMLGQNADPAQVDRLASGLAAQQMNGWVEWFGFPLGIAVMVLLVLAVQVSFTGPLRPARRLRTRRLVLRRSRPEDVPALHAILTDPPTLRYWGKHPHQSLAQTEAWLIDSEVDPDTRDEFVILRKGRVIGMIGARQWPWVTYLILDAEGGQGYGGEALKAFTGYAFDRGLKTLLVATDARNAASLAMVRRRGFREIGRMPITHTTGEEIEGVLLRLNKPVRRRPGLRRGAAPDKGETSCAQPS
jgi:RimJ/RimL family protein N-acetyltransferase